MARLYTNENFPLPAVEELRRLGHDVLTIYETGRGGQAVSDEDAFGFAQTEGRTLVTVNRRHFIRLHSRFPEHAGVIVCSFDPDFSALARRIHAHIAAQPDLSNNLIRGDRPQNPTQDMHRA